ncbi:DinB family protein [Agarivorans sp. JK6]|uniref:DinB family protein n=1 Tax=Agarivorans sp. JK6 TaxID=2997426 RepID=UPI003873A325
MKQLRDATVEALQQVQQLVEASDGALYNQPSVHSESGIGRHVRHILDHFLALQHGLDKGSIDYNSRHRDSDIENDPSLALQLIDQLCNWFLHPQSSIDERPIKVESEISLKQQQSMQFDSSLSRELCYLINHTVHHVAYAKLVAKELGLSIDNNMGIAPSTASYLRQQGN